MDLLILRLREFTNSAGFKKYMANLSWLFFGKVALMLLSFLVAAFVAKYLGPTQYGSLSYVISLIGIYSLVANLGVDSVVYRDLTMHPERERELLGSGFALKLIGGLLAITLVLITLPFLGNESYVNFLIVMAAMGFLFNPFSVITLHHLASLQMKKNVVAGLSIAVVLSILKIIFIFLGLSLPYFVFILVLEQLLNMIIFVSIYSMGGQSIFNWRIDKTLIRNLWWQSLPLMLSAASIYIYNRIDQVLIKQMMNAESVGYYDVAARLSEFWFFFPTYIITALFPAMINAKKTSSTLYHLRLRRLLYLVVVVSAVFEVAIYFSANWIVLKFFGAQYLPSVAIIKIYVWGGLGVGIGFLVNNYLLIEKRTTLLFWTNFNGAVVNILLNLFLIPRFGMKGAAFATLISYHILIVFPVVVRYLEKIKLRSVKINIES